MTVKMYRNTKKLLETTRLSISEIAEQVGYLNQSKSPPTAYCFSQLKQGTYLIWLIYCHTFQTFTCVSVISTVLSQYSVLHPSEQYLPVFQGSENLLHHKFQYFSPGLLLRQGWLLFPVLPWK